MKTTTLSNTDQYFFVVSTSENHFFNSKQEALSDFVSAKDFDEDVRFFIIPFQTEEYLETCEKYNTSTLGKDSPAIEKYFQNECLDIRGMCEEKTVYFDENRKPYILD